MRCSCRDATHITTPLSSQESNAGILGLLCVPDQFRSQMCCRNPVGILLVHENQQGSGGLPGRNTGVDDTLPFRRSTVLGRHADGPRDNVSRSGACVVLLRLRNDVRPRHAGEPTELGAMGHDR